jgi:hypothetical protein
VHRKDLDCSEEADIRILGSFHHHVSAVKGEISAVEEEHRYHIEEDS